jgi:UDP-glucose 4-epimerase
MKILVSGSSGRVGRMVVARLLERGDHVRGFDMRASGRSHDRYEEVVATLDDTDAVLHLGAFMSWAPDDRAKMFQANVEGTRALADAASDAGVARFIFASSGEVYPENAPEFLPVTEDHPLKANSPYGLTKLLGEEIIRYHQRLGKMGTVILRFSHTQDATELLDEESFFSGPRFFLRPRVRQQDNFGNHAVADILRAADPGHPAHILARNENGRPFMMHITDTRDMVQGILLGLDHDAAVGEVFNLGATDPVDFEDLLSRMSAITNLPVITVDLPGNGVYYTTSNSKIRNMLEFEPEWTINRMLDDAATRR